MLRLQAGTGWWAPACLIAWLIAGRAEAGALNPNSFPTLGNFPTTSGTYTINTTTLEFRDPSNGLLFTGTTAGAIAVFTFNGGVTSAINITATGSRPLALLFQGDVTYNGTLNAGGSNGGVSSAGSAGPGGGAGGGASANGSGPSAGGTGSGHGGGGGFGGRGGNAYFGGVGGGTYGDLAVGLQGGSGGGGGANTTYSSTFFPGGGGGGGGGAVEIGATQTFTLGGSVRADGGAGGLSFYQGGAGSGGALFLHAAQVTLAGSLSARGGATSAGGSGGGGRVLIQTSAFEGIGTISAAGGPVNLLGPNGNQFGQPGIIVAPSRPVSAEAGMNQTVTIPHDGNPVTNTAAFTLSGSGFDPDGASLSYQWKLNGTPVGNTATLPLSKPAGSYTYTLTVTNSQGASASDSVTVTVNPEPNQAPSLTNVPTTLWGNVYSPLTFTAAAGDADSDPRTFSLTSAPAGATIGAGSGVFSWTPNVPGSYTVTVKAADPYGASDTQSVAITVSALAVENVSLKRIGTAVQVKFDLRKLGTVNATNVRVTAATLRGVGTSTALPLVHDNIKAGASKQIVLEFPTVAAGGGTLVVNGTSANGPIYASLPVTVP